MNNAPDKIVEPHLLAALRDSDLFGGSAGESLQQVAAYFEWITVQEGQEIIREGTRSDFALLVVTGTFEISKADRGTRKLMAIAKSGAFLGELGLITDGVRYATCRAATDSEVGLLSREHFSAMRSKAPELYALMLQRLCQQLGKRLVQVTDTIFLLRDKNDIAVSAAKRILETAGLA
jgi:CRP/FNR family transcriptional regulator, cyclic AMP receptor protein